jgi:hypothetical protein
LKPREIKLPAVTRRLVTQSPGSLPIHHLVYNILAVLLISACSTVQSTPAGDLPEASPTPEVFLNLQTPIPTWTPSPTYTITPPPEPQLIKIWVQPELKVVLGAAWELPSGSSTADNEQEAGLLIRIGQNQALGYWIFTVVTAFPSLQEGLSLENLKLAWSTGGLENTGGKPLLLNQETAAVLSLWLGPYHPDGVRIIDHTQALEQAWTDRTSLAILPFQALNPQWKVLDLEGQNPLHKGFDPQSYPLAVPIGFVESAKPADDSIITQLAPQLSNFQPDRLTNVTLTGVTALVRGTALTMNARGVTYPAQDIRNTLLEADILHISNEIPFFSECPPPVLYPEEIKFCSSPEYIQLLEYIDADIIELDGDHFGDFGPQAMLETLQMYQERSWPYYGGGASSTEAHKPAFLTHNGNRFAFIGCNAKGIPYYATANEATPGAVMCDFEWLEAEIGRLKAEGYLVIATFQHNEYYRYEAQLDLIRDFQRVAQAGAVIVSGSQAHQPHGMEFYLDSFIHYGLGNLFFDQYRFFPGPELDRAFIDRHYFYNQRYINTELVTIKFIDLARSRLTTAEERFNFLQEIFSASGW